MAVSCSTALVSESFPARERGKGLGLVGVSISFGLLMGPVIGGFLLNLLDWRSIYYMRVPVSLLALLMALVLLKKDHPMPGKFRIDLMGALTSSVGIACIIYAVSQVNNAGLVSPLVISIISIGTLCLVAFIFIERRVGDPVVDLTLFKNPIFTCNISALFLIFVIYPTFILIMPFYLMLGLDLTPSMAGLLMAVPNIGSMIFAPIGGSLSDRLGAFWFSTLGAAAVTVSFILMQGYDLDTHTMALVLPAFIFGAGSGMFGAPNNSIIMGTIPKERYGSTSALIALQRQVGLALGMAFSGTIYSIRRIFYQEELGRQGLEVVDCVRASIPPAFHDALTVSIIIGVSIIPLSLVHARKRRDKNPV
jgi:EmrB/QacA subfamily drug resistance transporter